MKQNNFIVPETVFDIMPEKIKVYKYYVSSNNVGYFHFLNCIDIKRVEVGFTGKNARIILKNGNAIETINNYHSILDILNGICVSEKYFFDGGLDFDKINNMRNISEFLFPIYFVYFMVNVFILIIKFGLN